jgi:2-polyprenyl-6-methoxyphenol hydroxylase-like FAD-dependent oxidoreductase
VSANSDDTTAPTEASDVLIVGGGLAGLTLANYLGRQGREPLIVEQAPEWRDGGYGIGLWADGIDVLDELGQLDAVRERAADPATVEVRSGDRGVLTRTTVPTEETLLLAIHRGDLHAALREPIPEDWIRMDTEPERIDEGADGVDVTFDDGTSGTFDLVVGADGVHSTVREQCFADWTLAERDTYVWSLWAPQDVDLGSDMVSVWGPGSEGFVARVGDGVGFNLAAELDSRPDDPRAELRRQAAAIGWKLPDLLAGTDDEPFFDRVREVTCESWHTDRVALIGDAAHAVHPISGMGGSLALGDARVLAQELATGDPPGALAEFERRRRRATKRVQREARFEAATMFVESSTLRRLRDGVVEHTPLFDWFLRRGTREN